MFSPCLPRLPCPIRPEFDHNDPVFLTSEGMNHRFQFKSIRVIRAIRGSFSSPNHGPVPRRRLEKNLTTDDSENTDLMMFSPCLPRLPCPNRFEFEHNDPVLLTSDSMNLRFRFNSIRAIRAIRGPFSSLQCRFLIKLSGQRPCELGNFTLVFRSRTGSGPNGRPFHVAPSTPRRPGGSEPNQGLPSRSRTKTNCTIDSKINAY